MRVQTTWKTDAKDNEILRLVSTAFMTTKEIAERLFMSESTVRRRLAALEGNSPIKHVKFRVRTWLNDGST